jgi:hypothetical protein
MNIDEKILRDIISNAIQERKLFELIFTNEGRRIWENWPEEKVKKIVKELLKNKRRQK